MILWHAGEGTSLRNQLRMVVVDEGNITSIDGRVGAPFETTSPSAPFSNTAHLFVVVVNTKRVIESFPTVSIPSKNGNNYDKI